MDFELSDEQKMLKGEASEFLQNYCTREYVREMEADKTGFSMEFWSKIADLDWLRIIIPEQYGGSGGNFLDLIALLTEMGYYLTPGPYFTTVVLGALTILEIEDNDHKKEILPDLCNGKKMLTLAWVEEEGTYLPSGINLSAKRDGGRFVLSGVKLFVPDAHVADAIICAVRTKKTAEGSLDGISLFMVDHNSEGLSIEPLKTVGSNKEFEIGFNDVLVASENLLGKLDEGWGVLNNILLKAAVAKCAEMLGGAEKVMEMVLQYVNERVQFGKPIGAFQAVQHHCANMFTYLDTIKYMVYFASWRISEGYKYSKEASMCKAWVTESYRNFMFLAHQVIGGIGFMEEYDLQLYFRQAEQFAHAFGGADLHRELVAEEMGL
jgi:3-oxocholest-4-en-26-oyl-CoA dehydrogenase beta subunit